jgi:hypothetical protein
MTDMTKDCPFCAEKIMAAAIRCKHCHADLSRSNIIIPDITSGKNDKAIYCPNCHSSEWRLAKLIYENGLTSVNTSTSSTGVGVGHNGVGVGIGLSETSGSHQTELSRRAAPPTRRYDHSGSSGLATVSFIIGLPLIYLMNDMSLFKTAVITVVFVVFPATFLGMILGIDNKANETLDEIYESEKNIWENT